MEARFGHPGPARWWVVDRVTASVSECPAGCRGRLHPGEGTSPARMTFLSVSILKEAPAVEDF